MDKDKLRDAPVAVTECDDYDADRIYLILRDQFAAIGAGPEFFAGRRVALKPNLVHGKDPSAAVTTHPAVVEAVARLVTEAGAESVVLAESPGGSYSARILSKIYEITGMKDAAEKTDVELNLDTSSVKLSFTEGKKLREFDVLKPIFDADVVVDLCKLKTHSLTGMSGAVKNLFGVIPGAAKFEMHAAYPEIDGFSEMLCDLDLALYRDRDVLAVCDAVVSMEGNGPTHGKPVKTGLILSSLSTFALDVVAEHAARLDGTAKFLDAAAEKGVVKRNYEEIEVVGDGAGKTFGLELPDSKKTNFTMRVLKAMPDLFGGRFSRFFEPSPKINAVKCVGCATCARVCPQGTIEMVRKKGKRIARIKRKDCIRCFCCQELCPHGAVDTAKNPLIRLVH